MCVLMRYYWKKKTVCRWWDAVCIAVELWWASAAVSLSADGDCSVLGAYRTCWATTRAWAAASATAGVPTAATMAVPRCPATAASHSRPVCPGSATSGSWSRSSSTTTPRVAGAGSWPRWLWPHTCSPTGFISRPACSSRSWCTSSGQALLYPQVPYFIVLIILYTFGTDRIILCCDTIAGGGRGTCESRRYDVMSHCIRRTKSTKVVAKMHRTLLLTGIWLSQWNHTKSRIGRFFDFWLNDFFPTYRYYENTKSFLAKRCILLACGCVYKKKHNVYISICHNKCVYV